MSDRLSKTAIPTVHTGPRPLHQVAREIRANWQNVYFGAVPYLDAMARLDKITDRFGDYDADSIVKIGRASC
jgi:hypothetical protein